MTEEEVEVKLRIQSNITLNDCEVKVEGVVNDGVFVESQSFDTKKLHVNNLTISEGLDENICDKDTESDILDDDNDDETKENYEGYNGTARTVTLQMLLSANVLQPGKSLMTIEYLGQKFVGDLLPDGKIKSQETETIFLTPSAWAMYCKRIINPDKKSGCGWASVKYKGKKLDVYKNSWLRKCALQKDIISDDFETDTDKKCDSHSPIIKRTVFQHNAVCNRNMIHEANMLIEAIPFSAVGKLQPFLLNIKSSALLLADFHCHLTMHEVCGYLGGTWDVNTHTLLISKAYPCRNTRYDRWRALQVEREIQRNMIRDQIILVGWYHSHPKFQAEPTLRDCDSQLDFQVKMRGLSDITYTPCVSLIISPYYDENPTLESVVKSIWVVPPHENKQSLEYGRPMLMQYSVLSDREIPEEIRTEIQACVDYYSKFYNEFLNFSGYFNTDTTFIEKLKNSLYSKFPLKQNDKALWNWICAILDCEQEDIFVPPKTIKIIDHKDKTKEQERFFCNVKAIKETVHYDAEEICKSEDQVQSEEKASEVKVLSLQEQLCLPSGLNMNPVRMLSPLATPNPTVTSNTGTLPSIVTPSTNTLLPPLPPTIPLTSNNLIQSNQPSLSSGNLVGTSPCDSPVTIPSSSVSPAKFELPVRASPSPAKSDASSYASRPRNSPAASPGKFSMSDIPRNSPSITPNKYEPSNQLVSPQTTCLPTANDLMAASLAQLAGQLPSNFLQTDIATLFQQQRKDYGNSSLNQLAAAAAKVGNQKQLTGSSGSCGDITDPNVVAAVAAYSNSFNMPRAQEVLSQPGIPALGNKLKSERSSKSSSSSSSSNSSSNSYKTKLMKELDDLKNDPLKMSELMRSPEYAALLLQQAEALGATTLGTLGFSTDFSYLGGPGLNLSNCGSTPGTGNKSKSSAQSPAATLTADYNNIIQASKLLGYDSYMQQTKPADLNAFLQQQMGAVAAAAAAATVPASSSINNTKKIQQPHQNTSHHHDYPTLLQTYSKLFDHSNQFTGVTTGKNAHQELSALLAAGVGTIPTSASSTSKQKQKDIQLSNQTDVLSHLLHTDKQQTDLNALIYHQSKTAADLNALFATPVTTNSLIGSKSASSAPNSTADTAAYYSALAQEKMQDYATFFQQQQHGKYSIPDPLSKSTLAANNLFMSPSALLKIQQESLSAMMMKPPKSISSSVATLGRTRETSTSPALERLTPTKSGVSGAINSNSVAKYNFSAVDLAVSSVPSNTPSPAPSDGSSSSSHRRPSNTPPVDLSRLYGELAPPSLGISSKKRMEFSSVADLAAPPPTKISKLGDDVLNLSNE